MDKLIKSLVKAKSEFRAIKKTKTGMHKAKYAPMDEVLAATEAALKSNGIVVMQPIQFSELGAYIETTVAHESGQSISSSFPITLGANPQQNGSAITYARRYAYCSMLGITADEDDDADSTVTKNGYIRRELPSDPGQYVLAVGKNKGKKLSQVDSEELENLVDFLEKKTHEAGKKKPEGLWAVTIDMIEKYLGVD